jgi:hypothetical protein
MTIHQAKNVTGSAKTNMSTPAGPPQARAIGAAWKQSVALPQLVARKA